MPDAFFLPLALLRIIGIGFRNLVEDSIAVPPILFMAARATLCVIQVIIVVREFVADVVDNPPEIGRAHV